MTTATLSKTEARVLKIVGGTFHEDSVGPQAYQRTLDELRADPVGHLRAFTKLFVQNPPNPPLLTELHLAKLLQLTAPIAPEETRKVAAALARRMADSARDREAAYLESTDEADSAEISRGRQLLDERRYDIQQLLR